LVYPFITQPESVHTIGFGFIDLSSPNVYLAILAGAAQFWQGKQMAAKQSKKPNTGKEDSMMNIMNKQMLYMMPALTVFIGLSLPGGLTLYWFATTLLTALQQVYLFKDKEKTDVIEGEVKEIK
jgi:YidC/Oxa1 family membrane protein insertase